MDLSKLINGFVKIVVLGFLEVVTWICQSCEVRCPELKFVATFATSGFKSGGVNQILESMDSFNWNSYILIIFALLQPLTLFRIYQAFSHPPFSPKAEKCITKKQLVNVSSKKYKITLGWFASDASTESRNWCQQWKNQLGFSIRLISSPIHKRPRLEVHSLRQVWISFQEISRNSTTKYFTITDYNEHQKW